MFVSSKGSNTPTDNRSKSLLSPLIFCTDITVCRY